MGGGPSLVKTIMDSLATARGSAYTTDQDTAVMVENLAFAREIAAGYEANKRLANQFDPARMGESLARWTKILRIAVKAGMTDGQKRRIISALFGQTGEDSIRTYIVLALQDALGDVFEDVEYIPLASANITATPSGIGGFPFGTEVAGMPWSSTVCRVLVKLVKLTGMSEGEFLEEAGKVAPILDPVLPAWVTFDWYREPEVGTPIAIPDGPTGAGFYLNEPNLDVLIFS
jgi:hypothetical protein